LNQSRNKYDLIIIGGGASGLIAGCRSVFQGKKTLIIEKMNRPGRKLRITGKGKCNITNTLEISEFLNHVGPDPRFLYQIFKKFYNNELIDFFNNLGLKTVIERGGRVFPQSGKASDVVDILVNSYKRKGGKLLTGVADNHPIIDNKKIIGAKSGTNTFYSDKVIIATGGVTYPRTGSTGDGYSMASRAGHKINNILPVLVPLKTSKKIRFLNGLNLRNINISAYCKGKNIAELFGEMSFLDGQLSGPVIIKMSRFLVPLIDRGEKIILKLDMKPALDNKKLDNRIIRDINKYGNKPLRVILGGLMPAKIIPLCLSETRLKSGKPCNQMNQDDRLSLSYWLKNQKFEVSGYASPDEAIITSGGIDINEINPLSMESQLIKGLYFAGEIIDVDGDTGGFNLQIAFSTGWVAGA